MNIIICDTKMSSFYKQIKNHNSFQSDCVFLENEIEFKTYFSKYDTALVDKIFIHLDLDWSSANKSSFYGFDIAKELRYGHVRCLIHFMTFHQYNYFSLDVPKYALLKDKEHHFLITPSSLLSEMNKKQQASLMSFERLEDIQSSLLNRRALVRELLHNLKNQLVTEPTNITPSKILTQHVNQFTLKLNRLFPEKSGDIERQIKNLLLKLEQESLRGNKASLSRIIDEESEYFLELTPDDGHDYKQEPSSQPLTRWKLVMVEDDNNVRQLITSQLEKKHIDYHAFSNGEEALEFLKSNALLNRVMVFLCDLRLLNPDETWQKYQGYDLLREVYYMKSYRNYIALFALTSGRQRLLRLKSENIKVYGYYKRDVLSSNGAINMFIQKIRESGDQAFFKYRNRPKLKSWNSVNNNKNGKFKFPLAYYYRTHLFSNDFELAEEDINQSARNYVENVINNNHHRNSQINFTGTLRESSFTAPHIVNKFRSIHLVGRRIGLALFYHFKSEREVYNYMVPSGVYSDDSKKQLFNTVLALSFKKDLPKEDPQHPDYYTQSNLLEEELIWLNQLKFIDVNVNMMHIEGFQKDLIVIEDFVLNFLSNIYPQQVDDLSDIDKKKFVNLKKITENDLSSIAKAKNALKMTTYFADKYGLKSKFKYDLETYNEEIYSPSLKQYFNTIRRQL